MFTLALKSRSSFAPFSLSCTAIHIKAVRPSFKDVGERAHSTNPLRFKWVGYLVYIIDRIFPSHDPIDFISACCRQQLQETNI